MKHVVITGVSRGIGKATAEKFLAEGWFVIGTSTSGQTSLKHQHLQVHQLDLLNPRTIETFIDAMHTLDEKIDVLVNNAAILLQEKDAYPLAIPVLRKTLDVNLIGVIDITQQLLPFLKNGGSIVSVSSGLGSLTDTYGSTPPAYKISKAGINMFTRSLAEALRERTITVSSIDPGWVKTDMGGKGAHRDPSEPAKEIYDLATTNHESGYFWLHGKKHAW